MPTTRSLVVAILVIAAAPNAGAQSHQPWSAQGSWLYTAQDLGGTAGNVGGIGFEAQARHTFVGWSLGAGIQYSNHTSGPDALGLTGVFVEPRIVPKVALGPFAPTSPAASSICEAASPPTRSTPRARRADSRSAAARDSSSDDRRVNFDIGGAVVRQSLGNITLDDRNDTEVSIPSFFGYVVKAGMSIGFESSASSALRQWHR